MRYFRRAAAAATLAASLALVLAAPDTGVAADRSLGGAGAVAQRDGRFGDDLRACQSLLGGRIDQRRQVPAAHPRVAACLQRRGWASDGTPLLERLVAPG